MTGRKKKYKASKIRSFLFFLLLAIVFWVLTKFSEESSATVYGKLSYTNLPQSVSVASSDFEDIAFEVDANGFQFLSYNVRPPIVSVDISKYYLEGDSSVIIPATEVNKIISSQLDAKVNSASVKELKVLLDLIVAKKVPVILKQDMTFAEGFRAVGTAKVQPDSVVVSGPSVEVAQIDEVITETLVRQNVSESIEIELAVMPPENTKVTVSEETVQLQLNVEEFTQKQLTISIELVNAPPDITLKLIPESVVISFDVSVNRFNSISANDFQVVCDYESRSEAENILVPKLVESPEELYHIEWNTKRIEYLIFK